MSVLYIHIHVYIKSCYVNIQMYILIWAPSRRLVSAAPYAMPERSSKVPPGVSELLGAKVAEAPVSEVQA